MRRIVLVWAWLGLMVLAGGIYRIRPTSAPPQKWRHRLIQGVWYQKFDWLINLGYGEYPASLYHIYDNDFRADFSPSFAIGKGSWGIQIYDNTIEKLPVSASGQPR